MQTDRGVLIYRFLRRRSTTAWLETASFRRHRWTSKLAAGIQTVLATQTALFQYEIAFDRALTDFAKNLAEIERLVGEEVLR